MRARLASQLCFLRVAAAAAVSAAPLLARAEERGPGEIGHFIIIMAIFGVLFTSAFSFTVWLLIARLREREQPGQALALVPAAPSANLENIWFPKAADPERLPPPQ